MKWILRSEVEPPDDTTILIWTEGLDSCWIEHYVRPQKYNAAFNSDFTHWQPLPPIPKIKIPKPKKVLTKLMSRKILLEYQLQLTEAYEKGEYGYKIPKD